MIMPILMITPTIMRMGTVTIIMTRVAIPIPIPMSMTIATLMIIITTTLMAPLIIMAKARLMRTPLA